MKKRKLSLARLPWELLSSALRHRRQRALSVLRLMRQGSVLAAASRAVGMDPRTVRRHLGGALTRRSDGRYYPKATDGISRSMVIYSRGKQQEVTVPDSKTASTIGKYLNAVRKFLHTGDRTALDAFKGVTVIDANGAHHLLETNAGRLKAIESRKEDGEGIEIYKTG